MRKGTLSFTLLLALIAGMGIYAPPASLAVYPEKPVTFICVFPAGGAMDMTARALTEAARKYFPKALAVVSISHWWALSIVRMWFRSKVSWALDRACAEGL